MIYIDDASPKVEIEEVNKNNGNIQSLYSSNNYTNNNNNNHTFHYRVNTIESKKPLLKSNETLDLPHKIQFDLPHIQRIYDKENNDYIRNFYLNKNMKKEQAGNENTGSNDNLIRNLSKQESNNLNIKKFYNEDYLSEDKLYCDTKNNKTFTISDFRNTAN